MKHKLLVLCDPEEDYAQHMADYLCKKKEGMWEIVVYTKPEELSCINRTIDVLLISESVYDDFGGQITAGLTILLNESGVLCGEDIININKYQEAEKVYRAIYAHYTEEKKQELSVIQKENHTKIIGMYSPIRRCLQTTFALTYGQLLAGKHSVLYLSFEYYAWRQECEDGTEDGLSKLLYYLPQEKNLIACMKPLIRKVGELDYITSMERGENLLYVNAQEWLRLIQTIADSGEYEYIILDLSENLQGLYELLRLCCKIYTIVKEDDSARSKILQYEQLLQLQHYEDVRNRTAMCCLPVFHKLPGTLEQYTKGDLAEYVKELLYKGEDAHGL